MVGGRHDKTLHRIPEGDCDQQLPRGGPGCSRKTQPRQPTDQYIYGDLPRHPVAEVGLVGLLERDVGGGERPEKLASQVVDSSYFPEVIILLSVVGFPLVTTFPVIRVFPSHFYFLLRRACGVLLDAGQPFPSPFLRADQVSSTPKAVPTPCTTHRARGFSSAIQSWPEREGLDKGPLSPRRGFQAIEVLRLCGSIPALHLFWAVGLREPGHSSADPKVDEGRVNPEAQPAQLLDAPDVDARRGVLQRAWPRHPCPVEVHPLVRSMRWGGP